MIGANELDRKQHLLDELLPNIERTNAHGAALDPEHLVAAVIIE
jgi:hypothetical protein